LFPDKGTRRESASYDPPWKGGKGKGKTKNGKGKGKSSKGNRKGKEGASESDANAAGSNDAPRRRLPRQSWKAKAGVSWKNLAAKVPKEQGETRKVFRARTMAAVKAARPRRA
jgi:hypothetical protein